MFAIEIQFWYWVFHFFMDASVNFLDKVLHWATW